MEFDPQLYFDNIQQLKDLLDLFNNNNLPDSLIDIKKQVENILKGYEMSGYFQKIVDENYVNSNESMPMTALEQIPIRQNEN